MVEKHLFTSESVTEGHPDKVCDQVSDAILDACLTEDPHSRVAVETLTKTGVVVVAGELTTKAVLNVPKIVRTTLKNIGYTKSSHGIEHETCAVFAHLEEQSPDISLGVSEGTGKYEEQGAGDQGMMFGYACDETPEYMPLPIMLAHKLTMRLAQVRKEGILTYLGPDGKSQVSVEYEGNIPKRIDTVVVSSQHDEGVEHESITADLTEHVIKPICGDYLDADTKIFINPTGSFVRGGPYADAGLTGRKIIVDTYGGMGRHGGGAFSGKDPTKVDRSATYASRYIAKNIVAAGLAKRCEVQLAYAIGVAEPVSVLIDTFGTGTVSIEKLEAAVRKHFPLKPGEILDQLDLRKPIFSRTASYGHFGRDHFSWEQTDKVEALKNECQSD